MIEALRVSVHLVSIGRGERLNTRVDVVVTYGTVHKAEHRTN